jgi:hypothetical protein
MTSFDTHLWSVSESPDPVGSLREAIAAAPGEQVTVETIISDEVSPLELVRPKKGDCTLRQVGPVGLMHVEDEHGPFVLGCWPTAHEGVFHLVGSAPTTDPRWRKVERWVGNAAPQVVPVFLNHDDFEDVGTALSEHGEVEVSRMTARKRADQSSLSRGWPARSGSLRPTHHEAIADAEAEGASVRTLSLHVTDALSMHLRRLAGATFYNGDFDLFDRLVLGRLATAASRRRALLSGRERRVDEAPRRPISIRLPVPLLVDAEATGEVLAELESQRNVAVAVLHRNPYLHVVVTDYSDGSNFDLFVTDPSTIDIHPGFRASLGSLTLLTQQLGERFEAVEIAEAAPAAPVSLDDLLVTG